MLNKEELKKISDKVFRKEFEQEYSIQIQEINDKLIEAAQEGKTQYSFHYSLLGLSQIFPSNWKDLNDVAKVEYKKKISRYYSLFDIKSFIHVYESLWSEIESEKDSEFTLHWK